MNEIVKKFIIYGLAAFALVISWYPLSIFAQSEETTEAETTSETEFETAYNFYQTQVGEYQSAHAEYILKKTQYTRFKTLQSQQEAQEATVKMLEARDDVVISYMEALKLLLKESVGVSDSDRTTLNVRIDADIDWWTEHKEKIPSAGSLEDLSADSKVAQGRYNFVEPLFYEVMATISSGKITDFDERLSDIFGEVKDKIIEIKSEERDDYKLSGQKLSQLDRWILEADNRLLRAEEKHAEADKEIGTIVVAAQRRQNPIGVYNTAILRLNEAQQFLKDSGTYMKEIIKEVKTKE